MLHGADPELPRGHTLAISEERREFKLETGDKDKDKESARLATPVLPKAFLQRVRAAEVSGVGGTR